MSDAPAPTRAEEGTEWFWRIVNADGLGDVPSDEVAALRLLCRRAARAAQVEAEVARLRERVATLEAALQPFANYAADMPGADFGEGEIGEYYHDGFRRSIRTQDLRAARTALEAPHDSD